VLNPLSGEVCLAERLARSAVHPRRPGTSCRQWSRRGPSPRSSRAGVGAGRESFRFRWRPDSNDPHEARIVKLDASKARERLDWTPRWSLDRAIEAIFDWHDPYRDCRDLRAATLEQIEVFER
jgi:CDP-glucose 4,6-dehydratase